jgi:hypothetical protein
MALVVVVIEQEDAERFRITDLGQGHDEAETLGFGRLYRRQAEEVAKLQGLGATHGTLWLADLGRDQLVGATMALASAVLRTIERAMIRAGERRSQIAADRLITRLHRLFPDKQVRAEAEVRGASTHAWQVDAIVETERGLVLFDVVSPAPVSVAFAAAQFHDIALLENAPACIAVVRRKDAFGDLLPVVAQAAKVVQEDASDETFERPAKAARAPPPSAAALPSSGAGRRFANHADDAAGVVPARQRCWSQFIGTASRRREAERSEIRVALRTSSTRSGARSVSCSSLPR